MYSFRRLALLLALGFPALHFLQAQSSSSSSNPAPADQQAPASTQTQPQTQPQVSVQARIKARREQRRAAAIHEVYDHLYEGYVGGGYLRFTPGATLQRVNEYDWNGGLTRYFNERLGVTLDGRGYYGTPFVGLNLSGITKPAISQYAALIGPTYRFYLQPKYSVSGRVMGGYAQGNFSGDTNGFGTAVLGLYPDGSTYAASASIFAEYNLAPNLGVRVAPEYFLTGFGSKQENNLGYTCGLVYRFGRQ
ncbi:MAG TPA: hypothetical protein VGE83_02900 [Terracidiphilus sp.]|jgi:hypothetical protein